MAAQRSKSAPPQRSLTVMEKDIISANRLFGELYMAIAEMNEENNNDMDDSNIMDDSDNMNNVGDNNDMDVSNNVDDSNQICHMKNCVCWMCCDCPMCWCKRNPDPPHTPTPLPAEFCLFTS